MNTLSAVNKQDLRKDVQEFRQVSRYRRLNIDQKKQVSHFMDRMILKK